jgi:cytochrome c-type protein NapB
MRTARGLHVGLAGVVALTLAGFLAGVRENKRAAEDLRDAPGAPSVEAEAEARSYADMRAAPHGPNARLYDGAFAELSGAHPDPLAPVVQSDEDRRATLDARARRRAYDGAPPTIPHRIDQMAHPDCLGCHENGARVADRVAPRMSHERHDSCTQCHVVGADPRPGARTPPAPENRFAGMASPARGERAWPGAPPTIPHSTLMRGECSSCHGVFGPVGMRSTHPWRQSCTQCHAPSAELDRRAPSARPAGSRAP